MSNQGTRGGGGIGHGGVGVWTRARWLWRAGHHCNASQAVRHTYVASAEQNKPSLAHRRGTRGVRAPCEGRVARGPGAPAVFEGGRWGEGGGAEGSPWHSPRPGGRRGGAAVALPLRPRLRAAPHFRFSRPCAGLQRPFCPPHRRVFRSCPPPPPAPCRALLEGEGGHRGSSRAVAEQSRGM